jgi:hypothetical protein
MASIPSDDEAAAIAAAVERFVADALPGLEEQPAVSSWQRAALLEGVGAKAGVVKREGGDKWLS